MIENILARLTVALPQMGSPGPAIVSLVATGSTFGFRPGLRYLAGILLGNSIVLLMVATGLTGMVLAIPAAVPVPTTIGLACLLYLAWRIAIAPAVRISDATSTVPTGGRQPSAVPGEPQGLRGGGAAYASGSIVQEDAVLDTALKNAVLIAVNCVVNTTWLGLGAAFSGLLRNPRTGRAMNWSFAGLLIASVMVTILR